MKKPNTRVLAFLVFIILLLLLNDTRLDRSQDRKYFRQIEFAAVGDVMMARKVGSRISEKGASWPFEKVKDTLTGSGIAFCNLECPLSSKGRKINKQICFKGDPDCIECLTDAGFDIVSLANNHGLDCGRIGLTETMQRLEDAGIEYTGAGLTLSESALPTVIERNGIRVAFLSRNAWLPPETYLTENAANICPYYPDTIKSDIQNAKQIADVVILSLHWGYEYNTRPQPEQVEMAHMLIDEGVNVIVGHHPHVLQPVEEYHGGVIAYSLGNFLFDSRNEKCMKSLILKCTLTESGVSGLELVPVEIVDYRPVPAEPAAD